MKNIELKSMVSKEKKWRNKLNNPNISECKRKELYEEKRNLKNQIRIKCNQLKTAITDEELKQIENLDYVRQMYEAVKRLKFNDKKQQNVPYDINEVTIHYKDKFYDSNLLIVQSASETSKIEIKQDEVKFAISCLKNGRAADVDGINAEMLKFLEIKRLELSLKI